MNACKPKFVHTSDSKAGAVFLSEASFPQESEKLQPFQDTSADITGSEKPVTLYHHLEFH